MSRRLIVVFWRIFISRDGRITAFWRRGSLSFVSVSGSFSVTAVPTPSITIVTCLARTAAPLVAAPVKELTSQ